MDGWSFHGEGHLEGQGGAETAVGWEQHPQVSMEDGKRKPLMETGSLRGSTCWEEKSHHRDRTGASLSCLSCRTRLEQSLSCLEHLLQGHINLCYNAWRWLLQSHFIYGVFIGRGVGVQYNFSHSDVSISLTSHLHF